MRWRHRTTSRRSRRNSVAEDRIRSLRPHVHILDRGSEQWGGGVVWGIAGANATIRVRVEASINRDYTGLASDLPSPVVGAPVVVRLTGAFPYTVAEIRGSHFAGADGADQAGKIQRGQFYPAVVPRSITGDTETYWEA